MSNTIHITKNQIEQFKQLIHTLDVMFLGLFRDTKVSRRIDAIPEVELRYLLDEMAGQLSCRTEGSWGLVKRLSDWKYVGDGSLKKAFELDLKAREAKKNSIVVHDTLGNRYTLTPLPEED